MMYCSDAWNKGGKIWCSYMENVHRQSFVVLLNVGWSNEPYYLDKHLLLFVEVLEIYFMCLIYNRLFNVLAKLRKYFTWINENVFKCNYFTKWGILVIFKMINLIFKDLFVNPRKIIECKIKNMK